MFSSVGIPKVLDRYRCNLITSILVILYIYNLVLLLTLILKMIVIIIITDMTNLILQIYIILLNFNIFKL